MELKIICSAIENYPAKQAKIRLGLYTEEDNCKPDVKLKIVICINVFKILHFRVPSYWASKP